MMRILGDARREPAGDDGATAVITAVLVTFLFAVGALAVDLGNAYARDARIDSVAEQAAVAAARALPDPCAAALRAAQLVVEAGNDVLDESTDGIVLPDDPGAAAAAMEIVLTNGDESDGEVTVTEVDGSVVDWLDDDACMAVGTTARVVTPPAQVSFGLAAAAGFRSVDVRGAAGASLVSPLPVLPFAIPAECAVDPVRTYVVNPPTTSPTVEPVATDYPFTPPSTTDDPAPLAITAAPVLDATAGTVTLDLQGTAPPESWTWRIEMYGDGVPTLGFPAEPPPSDFLADGTGSLTAFIPSPAPAPAPGTWTLRVGREDPTGVSDAVWSAPTIVDIPGTPAAATTCGQPDVFGDVLLLQDDDVPVEQAIADGLPGPFRSGDVVSTTGLAAQGSAAAAVSVGLLDRLSQPGPPCDDDRGTWSIAVRTIAATNALSCYGVETAVTTPFTPFMLGSPEVLDDPRLFLVPVVDSPLGADDPPFPSGPQNMTVTGYRVAIISDEVPADVVAGVPVGDCTLPGTSTCMGVEVDSAEGIVRRLSLMLLDPAAVVPDVLLDPETLEPDLSRGVRPGSVRLDDNGYPWLTDDGGGPRDVHLVE